MARGQATVLLSGGIDSAACAHLLKKDGYSVGGLFVDFGQASAQREKRAAIAVSEWLSIPMRVLEIAQDQRFGAGEIPGRNAFLVFSALAVCRCHDGLLAIGIHAGTGYFDCSPSFIERVMPLVEECTNGRASVVAPFLHWTKDEVYSYFLSAELPLNRTYSCEAGDEPCGVCASCRDRKRLEC